MTKAVKERIRELTLGCYWSSRYFPKPSPRWDCIADELRGLVDSERKAGRIAEAEEAERLVDVAAAQPMTWHAIEMV